MVPFREVVYAKKRGESPVCFLVADIGGTNSNFGIVEPEGDKFALLLSLHIKSALIQNFTDVFNDVVVYAQQKIGCTITKACVGAAGVVSEKRDWVQPTNLHFSIDTAELQQKTGLVAVILINDFEAVGYGIGELSQKELVCINAGTPRAYANKAIVGAGTGLGKGIMAWDERRLTYMPVPSEGGHADFAAQTQQELALIEFIKATDQITGPVSWEHVLSGAGIKRIYNFLGTTGTYKETEHTRALEQNGLHPDQIFSYRMRDERCKATFELFAGWYGRCAKNFSLDVLALAGVYIAGGIASKNLELFRLPNFMTEFLNANLQTKLLQQMPLYVITDYNVSLYGAARYLLLRQH